MVTGRGCPGPRELREVGRSLLQPQWGQGLMCTLPWEAVSLCWSAGRPREANAWTPIPPAHLPSDLKLWGCSWSHGAWGGVGGTLGSRPFRGDFVPRK